MQMVPEDADAGSATRFGSGQFVRAHTPCTAPPCCSHTSKNTRQRPAKSNHSLQCKDGCWQVLHLRIWCGLQGAQLFKGLQRIYVHPLIQNHNQPA